MPRERLASLENLRRWRNRPDRDVSIVQPLNQAAAAVEKLRRAAKGSGEAWESLVPPRVRQRCQVIQVQRGVMTVRVKDAAARFEVDRWLRGGGEQSLLRLSGVKRVRLVL